MPLVLIREGDALDIALPVAAMRPRYVTHAFRVIQQVFETKAVFDDQR